LAVAAVASLEDAEVGLVHVTVGIQIDLLAVRGRRRHSRAAHASRERVQVGSIDISVAIDIRPEGEGGGPPTLWSNPSTDRTPDTIGRDGLRGYCWVQ